MKPGAQVTYRLTSGFCTQEYEGFIIKNRGTRSMVQFKDGARVWMDTFILTLKEDKPMVAITMEAKEAFTVLACLALREAMMTEDYEHLNSLFRMADGMMTPEEHVTLVESVFKATAIEQVNECVRVVCNKWGEQ